VRCDAVFTDAIAVAVFNGLGNVGGVSRFVAVPWLGGIRFGGIRLGGLGRFWRSGGGGGVGGVVEGCGANGGCAGEPRGKLVRWTSFGGTWNG
jgi:hypothetical protein